MSELSFSGRVVVVTGAGGTLGRAYALLFASRGASVLVNDVGSSRSGSGSSSAPAEEVAALIRERGGTAFANTDSVEDGARIVQAALQAFGRIDVIVNNAGFVLDQSFGKMDDESWRAIQNVHVRGAYELCRASWPLLCAQGHGRIIFTSSGSALYGNYGQANYAAAKMALVGLANTLAIEGAKHNVFVNTIAPIAQSRLTQGLFPAPLLSLLNADHVAPVVVFLCHESCRENGGLFEVGGGFVSKLRWQRSRGFCVPTQANSVEEISANWKKIGDFHNQPSYPVSLKESLVEIVSRIQEASSHIAAASRFEGFQSYEFLKHVERVVTEHGSMMVSLVGFVASYTLVDGPAGAEASFSVDLKNEPGSFRYEQLSSADVFFKLSDSNFLKLSRNSVSAQELFMNGDLEIDGKLSAALKFESVLGRASRL